MEQGLTLSERRAKRSEDDLRSLPDEAKELLDAIDLMPTMVGAPIFTKDDTWIIVSIAKFIVTEYPKLTLFDVQKAFSMGAKRELRNEKHEIVEVSSFGQKISANLVGKVLSAYEESKRRDRANGTKMFPSQLKSIEGPKKESGKMTPKTAYGMLVDECSASGKLPEHFYLYSMVYSYVKKHRGRDLFRKWGKDELKKMRRIAADRVKSRNGSISLSNRLKVGKNSEKEFKEMCVRRYFKEIAIPKMMKK